MSQWFFKDRQNNIQGPFTAEEMRAWYEAGYLNGALQISTDRVTFAPLNSWFPNSASAFLQTAAAPAAGGANAATGSQWYFVDKSNRVQGPFSDVQMRQWHMAGYFEPTLQIMNNAVPGAQWLLLRDAFPNNADAFLVPAGGGRAGGQEAGKAEQKQSPEDRFDFPEWLPVPPKFRGVKKVYPSEKNATGQRGVNITDVHGQAVQGFAHARARAPT